MVARHAKLAVAAGTAVAKSAVRGVGRAGAKGFAELSSGSGVTTSTPLLKPTLPGSAPNAPPTACVSAPLKPGWQYATAAWGTGAGALSALTGLGGAVVFIPACSRLGMTAKKIVGTTVVAVTCATTAGSYAYTQNNVTDIPAAFAIGIVGACTTPIGQRLARNVSGKTLRRWCGGALLACAPTAFMKKNKDGDIEKDGTETSSFATAEIRPGGAAALALAGKADELVARGGILEYLNRTLLPADPFSGDATSPTIADVADEKTLVPKKTKKPRWFGRSKDEAGSESGDASSSSDPTAHSVDENKTEQEHGRGESGSAWVNFCQQFEDRVEAAGGVREAIWVEREHLLLGVAVGMLQGTVGVGGGVLVTTYMSIMSDMEVHRICATALCATLVTNTVVCAHHFKFGNVRLRVAAVLGVSAMAASYATAKNVSLAVPEPVIRAFIAAALVASGVSMFK